jgi:hypothetical protein
MIIYILQHIIDPRCSYNVVKPNHKTIPKITILMGAKKTIPEWFMALAFPHLRVQLTRLCGIKGTHWSGSNSPFDLSSCGLIGDPRPGMRRMDGDFGKPNGSLGFS